MRLAELHYDLPPELIAQHPAEPRDAARLLVLDRVTGRIEHRVFREIGVFLSPGDGLVLNNTRVIPARFFCRRATGGRVQALFLRPAGGLWEVLLAPSARIRIGERLSCERAATGLVVVQRGERGTWHVRPDPPTEALDLLGRIGQTPLPPYIRRAEPDRADAERYQTVYATKPGAVAAPTAGLHFTPELLAELERAGVRQALVTLHVGTGTFTPIEVDDLAHHRMHAERYEIGAETLATLHAVRAAGRSIVAVGTTSVRALESLPDGTLEGAPTPPAAAPASGWTEIFMYPPYRCRHVDRLITNFHLPGSTLLALVMAFASPELIREAYHEAIAQRYRFYSYGDAMLIL